MDYSVEFTFKILILKLTNFFGV